MKLLIQTACVAVILASAALTLRGGAADSTSPDGSAHVYVGTTGRQGKGIYKFDLDLATGKATQPELAAEVANPSFFTIRSDGKILIAVGEVNQVDGKKTGRVVTFRIDPDTGALTEMNQQLSGGMGPCHVSLDRTERNALVSNYAGGSVAVLPLDADGRLSERTAFVQHEGSGHDKQRQRGPHAHSMLVDPGNRFAVAADLGLDKLLVYRFDPTAGTLVPADPAAFDLAPGSGPRHFTFYPGGKFAYVINELASTISVFEWNADQGTFHEIQTVSTLPEDAAVKNTTADVHLHPSGKFLYGSNRGHDSIAIFRVDESTGRLTPGGHQSTGGKVPRNFCIHPSGDWLLAANQNSGTIHVFRIDSSTGALEPAGEVIQVSSPTCVKFLPVD